MQYPYEVLAYVARVSFRDAHGLEGVFDHYQRIRVLAPDLQFLVEHIWGDGDQLNSYVSPSVRIARRADLATRTVLLTELDRTARVGDEVEVFSTRRIHHGFKNDREWWEFKPFFPTNHARIAISFPLAREPFAISVGASRGARSPRLVRQGLGELVMPVDAPPTGSLYRLDWSW